MKLNKLILYIVCVAGFLLNISAQERLNIQRAFIAENVRVSKIWFLDDMMGWSRVSTAVGEAYKIYRTDDGGKNWKTIHPLINDIDVISVWFATKSKGWAVCLHKIETPDDTARIPMIISTENGGDSWEINTIINEYKDGLESSLITIYFHDELHGWAAGSSGVDGSDIFVFATENGGKTWSRQHLNKRFKSGYLGIEDISFSDLNNGWAVGVGFALEPEDRGILHTNDGGKSWNIQETSRSGFHQIAVIDSNNVWAVGGKILKTTDGGKNWIPIVPQGYDKEYWHSIKFIDAKRGWIGSSNDVLLYTENGGQTWENQFPATGVSRGGISSIAVAGSRIFLSGTEKIPLGKGIVMPSDAPDFF